MPEELIWPSVVMTLALVSYTTGVWAERITRDLRNWHVAAFFAGWGFDAYGTWMMGQLRIAGRTPGTIHGLTGTSAFALMGIHAIWAAWVRWKGNREARAGFHRYSLAVWGVWLVPYFGGMIAGIVEGLRG